MSRIKIWIVYAAYLLDRCVDKVKSIFKKKDSERGKWRGWPYRR